MLCCNVLPSRKEMTKVQIVATFLLNFDFVESLTNCDIICELFVPEVNNENLLTAESWENKVFESN